MLKEAIEKIQQLAATAMQPTQIKIGEQTYCNRELHKIYTPLDEGRGVSTLTGIIDLIAAGLNGIASERVMLHVGSHADVTLCDRTCNEWGQRQIHARADLPSFGKFQFGTWLEQEPFIIGLQSFFAQGMPDMDYLYKMAGRLKAENVQTSEDDGITQSAAVRMGAVLAENVEVKRSVTLRPWRTFREIEQPEGQFIFRLKPRENQIPLLSLHVADGEMWQLKSMQDIKEWLTARTDVKVIA